MLCNSLPPVLIFHAPGSRCFEGVKHMKDWCLLFFSTNIWAYLFRITDNHFGTAVCTTYYGPLGFFFTAGTYCGKYNHPFCDGK